MSATTNTTPTRALVCCCATHNDGTRTTWVCPTHADADPCLTMASMAGKRRRGSVVRGCCSRCGWLELADTVEV